MAGGAPEERRFPSLYMAKLPNANATPLDGVNRALQVIGADDAH